MAAHVASIVQLYELAFIGGCVLVLRLLAWLVGLVIILRGSKCSERPDMLRAYARCSPLISTISRERCFEEDASQLKDRTPLQQVPELKYPEETLPVKYQLTGVRTKPLRTVFIARGPAFCKMANWLVKVHWDSGSFAPGAKPPP
jgi:hypothetical protein